MSPEHVGNPRKRPIRDEDIVAEVYCFGVHL